MAPQGPPEGSRACGAARLDRRDAGDPEAGICARPGLPPAAVQALKRALLGMKKPEHATALKGIYDIDGFVRRGTRTTIPSGTPLTLMDYRPRR